MIDTTKLLTVAIEAGSFISAFAAIVAGIVMFRITRKFGSGFLASGFKSLAIGVFFIAAGILVDAIQGYIQTSNFIPLMTQITIVLTLVKELLFVLGTYIIVIGSKKTGDKLESLTK